MLYENTSQQKFLYSWKEESLNLLNAQLISQSQSHFRHSEQHTSTDRHICCYIFGVCLEHISFEFAQIYKNVCNDLAADSDIEHVDHAD